MAMPVQAHLCLPLSASRADVFHHPAIMLYELELQLQANAIWNLAMAPFLEKVGWQAALIELCEVRDHVKGIMRGSEYIDALIYAPAGLQH